jgi:hypothetical protein
VCSVCALFSTSQAFPILACLVYHNCNILYIYWYLEKKNAYISVYKEFYAAICLTYCQLSLSVLSLNYDVVDSKYIA